ncbi:AraC family transcriptional regulator ligand-binding domain-containing protein [Lutimaribacter marinistellae]|uniref:AraC family transcriptional regulator ligand-binding domain-containing protein n=1 Tax=Lutimaribacter marinistellae TaxID=1820329 RepID=A0ABV7TLD1_9RHOB
MTTIRGWGAFPDLVEEMAGAQALRMILPRHDLPLSVLDAPDHRMPLAKMMRVFEAAARVVGDEAFGVRLGRRTTAADYGPWAGYAYCAPTLGQALKRVCSTLWAHESGTRMYLADHAEHVVWCYASGLERREQVRHFSDHLFETMLVFFRGFLGPLWRPDWVEVDYEKPAKTEELDEYVGTEIRFARPNYGLAVRKVDLSATLAGPLPFARPITSLDLDPQPEGVVTVDDMMSVIDLRMMGGSVDLDGLARALDLGPRTLQRKLSKLGYSYKQLLEVVRRKRAIAFLLETDLPVKAIAAELGYDGPQNFTRAFNAWYAASPSQFRARGSAHRPLTETGRLS